MEIKKNKQVTFLKRCQLIYFSKLIKINQQKGDSLGFVISIEILRFIFGHSLVYCIFLMSHIKENQEGSLILSLRKVFNEECWSNYQNLKKVCYIIFCFELVYLVMFMIKQEIQDKFNFPKILYYAMKYMGVSCEFLCCILGIVCYLSMYNQQFFVTAMSLLSLLLAIFLFKLTSIFQQKNKFETDDRYAHNQNLPLQLVNLLFCIMTFLIPVIVISPAPDVINNFNIAALVLLQILKIKYSLIIPYYQTRNTHIIYCLGVCFQTAQLLLYVLLDVVYIQLIENNSLSSILIITMFLHWGMTNYTSYLMIQSYFLNVEELKTKDQFYLLINSYFYAMQSLEKESNLTEISLIVSSIRKNHQINCKNPQCYCYTNNQLKQFIKSYIQQMLVKLQAVYSHNHRVMLYITSFKFHVYHHYTKVLERIDSLQKTKNQGIIQMMQSMTLKYKLQQWLEQKNQENKVIHICLAIKLQEDITILNEIILDDIEVKYKKWTTFSKELSRIEEVRKMSHKELENLIKVSQIKVQKWNQYSRSPVFNLMLYFYFKRVVLKTSDLGDIEENIRNLGRKIKEEEITRPTFFEKYLFHKNACTIQSSLHQNSLGMIISTSRSIERVFGYSHKRIVGENISCLFPPFLAKEQHAIMKEWFDKGGNIQTVSKVTETYCHHKQNYGFVAQKYIKVYMFNGDIFLITTFFKKKQNDLILINDKFELEIFGKSLKTVLKHIGHKIQCDYVFKGMRKKLLNADLKEEKTQKTIIFNQTYTSMLLNGEKTPNEQSNSHRQLHQKQSNQEFFNDSTKQLHDIWRLTFTYVKVQMGDKTFYKIEAKVIEEVKKLFDFVSKKEEAKQIQSDLNYANDSDSENGISKEIKVIQLGEQQNSSMASFSSQLGYGISKLISHFSFILLNPKKLCDQRIKQKILIDIVFYILLVSILTATISINKFSLEQKTISLKAKSRIDSVFHLLEISSNHAYNLYMYKKNDEVKNTIMEEINWDSDKFVSELKSQFAQMQEAITNLQGEVLYDYLKIPVNWTFTNSSSQQCQLLEIFNLCHYVFLEIKTSLSQNSTYDVPSYTLLTANIAQLRKIRQNLITITQKTLLKNDSFSINYLIITLILLFVFSAFFGIYSHLYRKFRFDQSQNHIKVYLMIPHQILKNLTEYYSSYYKHYVLGKIRIDSALQSESQMFEPELEEITQNQQLTSNKIKLMGKGSYLAWIGIAVIFILLNGGNAVISYNMFNFNRQVDFFYRLTNSISISESMLVNRLIRMKSQYYFNRGMLNQSFITLMLSTINQTQVAFNSYVTFDSNTITDSDPTFRIEFNKILTTNPCVLHQDTLDQNQLKICNQEAVLSKNGIITFVNGFARLMQNTYLSWQKNLSSIINSTDIFANSTQFRQYDLMVTFHIPTFRKLSEKIIGVYQNGFNYQYQTYFIIYLGLVIFLALLFVENIYKTFQDKLHLSFLYGYILLFPPSVLKQSKYLLKFIQTNLEFSEKH